MRLVKRLEISAVAVAASVALVTSAMRPALAASSARTNNVVLAQQVSQLENRFFEHSYDDESTADRLARLEKLTFGQVRQGSNQERLNNLLSTIPSEPGQSTAHNVAPPAVARATHRQPPSQKIAQASPGQSAPRMADTVPFAEDYSHNPSPYRSDARYQQPPSRGYQQSSGGQASGYQQPTNDYQSAAYGDQPATGRSGSGMTQAVSALEMQALGETHGNESLPVRLSQLENAVFASNADHSGSLSDRINRLSVALGLDSTANSVSSAPTQNYHRASASKYGDGVVAKEPKQHNGHPILKNVAKTALVVGAVAGATALTIMAVKGMSGGHHHLDLD